MTFYQESINSVLDRIMEKGFLHDHIIVVGDNSCGKSYMLRELVEKLVANNSQVYFLDAVNRGFDIEYVLINGEAPDFGIDIVNTRIREDYFNTKDSFAYAAHDTERVERIYSTYEKNVQKNFRQLTGDGFEIIYDESPRKIRMKEEEGVLSSGYQALIRMLLEIEYFQRSCVKRRRKKDAWIIIDEIDEFLSPRNARKLLPFLIGKFPAMRFVVSTHSCDVVASMKEANIVVLREEQSEVLDAGDYMTLDEPFKEQDFSWAKKWL